MPHPEDRLVFQVGTAFYRPQMRHIRDLGVLAAMVYRQTTGQLRVLEPMSGCGIRSLRYGLEAGADWIWANDANPALQDILQANLDLHLRNPSTSAQAIDSDSSPRPPSDRYRVTAWNAQVVFAHCTLHNDRYDFIDLDGFGNLSAYGHTVWNGLKPGGLLYWTATDGQILGGHDPDRCLQKYGTYGRSFPCAQEQGLRILLGTLAAAAQQWGITLKPIFSTFTGQTFRVLIQAVQAGSASPSSFSDRYGFLGYCHHCGAYQTVGWRTLGQALCSWHDPPHPLTLSGPLWLGALHHLPYLQAMQTIAATWNYLHTDRLLKQLELMIAESDLPPYHFSLGQLGKWAKTDPPNRDVFLQTLADQGYRTAVLHWNPECFKTTANWPTCLKVATNLNSQGDRSATFRIDKQG